MNKLKNLLFLLLLLSLAFIFTADSFAASRLRILNTRLSVAKPTVSYGVNLYADGGVPFPTGGNYKWCTTTAAPRGLLYTCNGTLASSTACDGTGTWQQCTSLNISGTVTATASVVKLPFYVMDNDNNITNKTLSLTINPCTSINIVNNTGGILYYGGACTQWNNGANAIILPAITSFQAYSDAACNTTPCGTATSYVAQQNLDIDPASNNCTTQVTVACAYSDN